MNALFLSVYDKLEAQRLALLNKLENIPEERIKHSHASDKWSIAQILTHLLTSEKLSVEYMKKKSLGIDSLQNSGIKQAILLIVLRISQRIPFRYTAPRVIVENTPEAMPLSELAEKWEYVRNDLKKLLDGIDDKHIKKVIFKHPVAGRLNALQAMDFMYEHVNHHIPQINNLLKRH